MILFFEKNHYLDNQFCAICNESFTIVELDTTRYWIQLDIE
jgi:hypothetical protein